MRTHVRLSIMRKDWVKVSFFDQSRKCIHRDYYYIEYGSIHGPCFNIPADTNFMQILVHYRPFKKRGGCAIDSSAKILLYDASGDLIEEDWFHLCKDRLASQLIDIPTNASTVKICLCPDRRLLHGCQHCHKTP